MHCKPFGGRALLGPAGRVYSAPTNPLTALKMWAMRKEKGEWNAKQRISRKQEGKENIVKKKDKRHKKELK